MGNRIAQVAFTFMVMMGMVFLVFLIFIAATNQRLAESHSADELAALQDLASKVQKEILIASQAKEGYSRTFNLPEKLGNIDYTISTDADGVVVQSSAYDYFLLAPSVVGDIQKGSNMIKKINGSLCFEDAC